MAANPLSCHRGRLLCTWRRYVILVLHAWLAFALGLLAVFAMRQLPSSPNPVIALLWHLAQLTVALDLLRRALFRFTSLADDAILIAVTMLLVDWEKVSAGITFVARWL